MAVFRIHASKRDGNTAVLVYDNQTSALTWDDGTPVIPLEQPREWKNAVVVSEDQPGRKGLVRVLKVSLGMSCNYECNYCSQRFVPHADSTNPEDIAPFVAQLTDAMIDPPERIEFWGGEPFVYWKTLKPLAERLRALFPEAAFSLITNGSLLDPAKNEWLDRMGFSVGLSHDGPGYHARGVDPLSDPDKRAAIMDLWGRLGPKGRMSVNAMMHADNQSRAHVQAWLQKYFGMDVPIGEGSFIDPYDEGGMASTFKSAQDHIRYRSMAFKELRLGLASRFNISREKIVDFVNSVKYQRPASSLGQKCAMDRPDNIAVDLHGNVITCQNVSAAATAPNGQQHKLGHISNLQAVKLRTSTHWSKRTDCSSCPVLQLCKGSCMFLEGPLWEAGCDAAYSDNVPFFAAAIEFMTGCVPYYIKGARADRQDIFGQVHGIPKPRRVIPIHQTA